MRNNKKRQTEHSFLYYIIKYKIIVNVRCR